MQLPIVCFFLQILGLWYLSSVFSLKSIAVVQAWCRFANFDCTRNLSFHVISFAVYVEILIYSVVLELKHELIEASWGTLVEFIVHEWNIKTLQYSERNIDFPALIKWARGGQILLQFDVLSMIVNVKEYRHKMSVILCLLHYRFAYCHLAHNFGVRGGFIRLTLMQIFHLSWSCFVSLSLSLSLEFHYILYHTSKILHTELDGEIIHWIQDLFVRR